MSRTSAYNRLVNFPPSDLEKINELEKIISTSPKISHKYASITGRVFPKCEKYILRNPSLALDYFSKFYNYNAHQTEKLFELEPITAFTYLKYCKSKKIIPNNKLDLEKVISRHSVYSYKYAKDILRGKFELGEKAIARSVEKSILYATEILRSEFPLAENKILESKDSRLFYRYLFFIKFNTKKTDSQKLIDKFKNVILNNVYFAFDYLSFYDFYEIFDSVSELEAVVSKKGSISFNYAVNVLKDRFYLAEPEIAKDASLSIVYSKIFRFRFELAENVIFDKRFMSNYGLDVEVCEYINNFIKGRNPKIENLMQSIYKNSFLFGIISQAYLGVFFDHE